MTVPTAATAPRGGKSRSRVGEFTIAPKFEALLRGQGITSLDALFGLAGERLDKAGLAGWRERLRIRLEGATFYLKRYSDPPRRAVAEVRRSGSGGRSLAEHEWAWMRRLAGDGIPTIEPVAFGHELIGRREVRSAIVAAEVAGESLEAWVKLWTRADRARFSELFGSVARLVGRFHGLGYVHRDLYLSHLYFDGGGAEDGTIRLIDLQRVMRPGWRRQRWVVKDLAALNFSTPGRLVSSSDRLRWLKAYLGTRQLGGRGRRLVYRVVGKTLAIERHERSRVRRGDLT